MDGSTHPPRHTGPPASPWVPYVRLPDITPRLLFPPFPWCLPLCPTFPRPPSLCPTSPDPHPLDTLLSPALPLPPCLSRHASPALTLPPTSRRYVTQQKNRSTQSRLAFQVNLQERATKASRWKFESTGKVTPDAALRQTLNCPISFLSLVALG